MRANGERDVLVESITRKVLQELLGALVSPNPGEGAVATSLDLEGRVGLAQACVACKLYVLEAQRHRSTVSGALAPIVNEEPDADEDMEGFLEAAVAYAQEAAGLIQDSGVEGAAMLASRATAAEDALAAESFDLAIDHLMDFCHEAKSWWHGGDGVNT